MEPELLHTYSKVYKADVLLLIVRLAVLTAVTLTVPVVLFPVSVQERGLNQRFFAVTRILLLTSSVPPQIRTSVNQLLCASKDFSWIRHTLITVVLLAGTNALVIFVPTIRDIFGFIGKRPSALT